MEKINDDELKRELPFDLYGRYAIIRDIINHNRINNKRFRVLDVGGRGNMLSRFLPNDDVFYLDPLIESEDKNFIKGDGCAMDLKDESFDWVTSADVFEHIPKEKRNDFMKENIRVAKLGVVLAAPFWSKEVEKAEENANNNYKVLSNGEDHLWLKEHIKMGLPEEDIVENFCSKNNYVYQKVGDNDILMWSLITGFSFNFDNELLKSDYEEFNYFYNSNFSACDNESTYRKVFFIKKDEKLMDLEIKKEKRLLPMLEIVKRVFDIVGKNNVFNRDNFIKLFNEVKDLNSSMSQKDNEIERINKIILQKDDELKKMSDSICNKEDELRSIKSSKLWKLRKIYSKIKNYGRK